jgi:hypothetical protein
MMLVVIAKISSQYFPGGTEENLSHNGWSSSKEPNPIPPDYDAGVLTTQPLRL